MISRCHISTSTRLRRYAFSKSLQISGKKCPFYHPLLWDGFFSKAVRWESNKSRRFNSSFGWFQQVSKLEWFGDGKDSSEMNKLVLQYAKEDKNVESQECLVALEQRADEVFPDLDAYSAVLNAWLRQSENAENADDAYIAVEKATGLLFRMRDQSKKGLKPSIPQHNAVLEAWGRISQVKGSPQQSQKVLEEMEHEHSINCKPTIESYNLVLSSWAGSQEHLRGSAAQEIFERILIPKNDKTYRIMIQAWSHSKEVKAAFRATGHLMKMLRLLQEQHAKGETKSMEPTVENYHSILKAWTEARDKHAAGKAFNVLRLLEDTYLKRYSDLQADLSMYRFILQTHARSKVLGEPVSEDSGDSSLIMTHAPTIDKLLSKIWDRQYVPDTVCFASAITTYANCAVHESLADDPLPLAKRAEELLQEMVKSTLRSDTVEVATEHYNTVLRAYTATKREEAVDAAFKLLDTMENSSDNRIWPNSTTYSLVLTILTKSESTYMKVEEGEKLMSRALRQLRNYGAKPDIFLYNALIRAIASDVPSERTFRKTLQILREIHESKDVEANSETFYCLLEASASLLETGPTQFGAMEKLFSHACDAGLIDRPLLTLFRSISPPSIFSRIVVDAAKIDDDGTRVIPTTW
eukprot:CAMPEP_0194213584 /NCGR_PEP_ID=MMETSP0156-20130528/14292_1 /TAXON_ID=33649 /ORGANISM="Thalassionema nitzschioides, Strain L26-B" /LENGTH=637 /DNA_ID=CAMNT_0038941653 /DNA_START=66 /DNA_END=1976 /DNA_ORIENTATION=+